MSLLLGVNYVGGREDGCLTSPPLEWTGLPTLFATPSQFVVAQALAGAATAARAPKGLLVQAHRGPQHEIHVLHGDGSQQHLVAEHHGGGVHRSGWLRAVPANAVAAGWRCAQGWLAERCRESCSCGQIQGGPAGDYRRQREQALPGAADASRRSKLPVVKAFSRSLHRNF